MPSAVRATRPPEPAIKLVPALKHQPQLAERGAIAELSRNLTDGALQCRTSRRHDWRSHTVKQRKYGFDLVERCDDCGSERKRTLDRRGLVVETSVTYSEGYLNPPGTGRVDAEACAEYRLELLGRYLKKDLH